MYPAVPVQKFPGKKNQQPSASWWRIVFLGNEIAFQLFPEGDVAAFLGNPLISLKLMALTSGVLTVIGLAAGVFPARRAALVNPVESLRFE